MRDETFFNQLGEGYLPAHLGLVITHVGQQEVRARLDVRQALLAPNGYLHAGTVVALADTTAGYGCVASLPEGASGFTTIETKSNHLGTAREGTVVCVARCLHAGRTTQVWDAEVVHQASGQRICVFRCTQMILWPR
jgi:1,4-dihydroxy-2-naphthoyl-CoA hydrolase